MHVFRPAVLGVALMAAMGLAYASPQVADVDARGVKISEAAYPGTIRLEIDATDLGQRVFKVRQTVPVQPGLQRFHYPAWLPGSHSPTGQIEKLAGLVINANGQRLQWVRDPLDVYTFNVQVPEGVSELRMDFQFLSPTDSAQGRTVMTPNMLNLQWNAMLLYPAGHAAHAITYQASARYPQGWDAASALTMASRNGDTVNYAPTNLEILVDSPVFAGRYHRMFELAPAGTRPVRLNVFADRAKDLEAKPEHIEQHRALVTQARKLFGAEHYDHYDFLFAVTNQLGGIGLEHQRSSENSEDRDYFSGWDAKIGSSDLLGHEYTHSWDGKYRRPADLATLNYNVPMQGSLLWVYEGQTQYWGNVLTARAGIRPQEASRDALAMAAATYADNRPGLEWRSLGDTTNDPVIARRKPKPYRGYQMSEDYYQGGQMLWLEADVRLRTLSGGKRSLDDFAKAFFGQNDGQWERPDTYTFDDVAATLEQVQPTGDWSKFLAERVDHRAGLVGGIEAAGWKLVYKDKPSAYFKAMMKGRGANFIYSLGVSLSPAGYVNEVRWDSAAFNAGVGTGMQVLAVNDLQYSADELEEAVRAAKDSKQPVRLLVKEMDVYRTLSIDYHDGLRYPTLERIEGKADYLTPIFSARK
ncbi:MULTISPECIES: M61 family metallopeptidase [Stenotrophomonas]|uniref:M61 family metallopeptidase n=1 Tax=Stenotrophomonas sp. KCTC 12332 TaxID=1793721 RepID=UPI0007705D8A|nr:MULTISPECIES: M61 family metallopeptidase [Stenotrophomonas]AMJ58357.1 peptidase M61 [Stenotrophomonas sp. KCTC 12332]